MKLVSNWRDILRRAWTVRLTLLAGLLDGAFYGWSAFTDSVPPFWFAGISIALSLATVVARIADQGIGHGSA